VMSLAQTYFNANADRLNQTATRLTVVGTIFVTWTLVTGFFGQNFGWLVRHVESENDFMIFGIGGLVLPSIALGTLFWVKRRDWF
jgi:magnesium transporter